MRATRSMTAWRVRAHLRALGVAALLGPLPALAAPAGSDVGKVSGLPVPRFVSVKADRVNVRGGPDKDHDVAWVYTRAGWPVEIVAEFETWRRIRDAEGTEGWVLHSLLSGRRTALVSPWTKGDAAPMPLYEWADERAEVVARLQPNVIVNVKQCTGAWCRVTAAQAGRRDLDGYIRQERLWGVYPNERVE